MDFSSIDQSTSSDQPGPQASNAVFYPVKGTTFAIDRRYSLQRLLGAGAYGKVALAMDSKTNESVAIKKLELAQDKLTFARRALRELKFLRLLQHENIVDLYSLQLPVSRELFQDIYIVQEWMQADLKKLIRSPQKLSEVQCQFLGYQLVKGVQYMHKAGVIHRDLKPQNLLVNSKCTLKICDFGLARAFTQHLKCPGVKLSNYIATRWYRAPEVLMNWKTYDTAVDMWAVGAILAELLLRKPLFPGRDNDHQLQLILDTVGKTKGSSSRLEEVCQGVGEAALDLLKKLLVVNPAKRINATQALAHPYFAMFKALDKDQEVTPFDRTEFEFEQSVRTVEQMKDLIYEEILRYHSV